MSIMDKRSIGWHRCFAWRPIRTLENKIIWLKPVLRSIEYKSTLYQTSKNTFYELSRERLIVYKPKIEGE